jgi:hypothetical protein
VLTISPALWWFPAVVSIALLAIQRVMGELSGRSALLFGGWFAFALALEAQPQLRMVDGQFRTNAYWVAGIVLQTALAVCLAIRLKVRR